MIRRAIRTYLKSVAPLTDLIGGSAAPHLYLNRVPKGATPLANYPAVIFRRATGGYGHDLDGSDGKSLPEFEFLAIGTDPETVEAIAEQLRLALQGFTGTWDTIEIDTVLLDDEFDDYQETKVGDDEYGFHTILQVYRIGHTVPKPSL